MPFPNSLRRANWRPRILPGSTGAYLLAIFFVGIATALRWALGFVTQDLQAFTTFYPAVLFATLVGGAGPGIAAALLGGFICWWEFLAPYTALFPLTPADTINVLTYVIASVIIVWATDHYRKLTKKLKDEENFRKLAVDELAHRLKNKIATIQSIINFRLREHTEIKAEIDGALAALMAVDNLITDMQGRGAHIGDILSAELQPYDMSRIAMSGPAWLLSPRLALTMALLVHELATNAAKYGALSGPEGKLSIDWSFSDGRLFFAWTESDGPPVSPPDHSGFGSRLFARALEQFDGKVDATFPPTGFVCRFSVAISDMPKHSPAIFQNVSRESAEKGA
jgi:two-component sensor histidine kinase